MNKVHTYRIPDQEIEHLLDFQARNKLKTQNEALRLLLQDHKTLEDFFKAKDVNPNDPALECYRRMSYHGKIYCVSTPLHEHRGLPTKTLLPSVEVCAICRETRLRKLGVKFRETEPQPRDLPKPKPQPIEKPLLCPMSGEPFQPDPYCIQCQKAHQKDWFKCEVRRYYRATGKTTVTVKE